jgi:pSer/pThr/pTyr-binding forkhead associated (FHA) protein
LLALADDEDDIDRVMPDEAFSLDAFRRDCELSLAEFAKLHGKAFLLLQRAGKERLSSPQRPARTLVSEGVRNRSDLPPSKYLVFPVRKTERSLIERFFSLGQTRNNDIVVRDVSVSKSHAFFQEDEQGDFTLLDARSTNGTFINGERVPRHGQGDPVRVRSGDQLRFGNVELSFIEASIFKDLVRTATKV